MLDKNVFNKTRGQFTHAIEDSKRFGMNKIFIDGKMTLNSPNMLR